MRLEPSIRLLWRIGVAAHQRVRRGAVVPVNNTVAVAVTQIVTIAVLIDIVTPAFACERSYRGV